MRKNKYLKHYWEAIKDGRLIPLTFIVEEETFSPTLPSLPIKYARSKVRYNGNYRVMKSTTPPYPPQNGYSLWSTDDTLFFGSIRVSRDRREIEYRFSRSVLNFPTDGKLSTVSNNGIHFPH